MWISKNTKPFTDEQKELFERHKNLAARLCRKFVGHRAYGGAEFCDDMKGAAMIGLLCAAQQYEKTGNGRPFPRYAAHRIRAAMVARTYENATGAVNTENHKARIRVMTDYARTVGVRAKVRGVPVDSNSYEGSPTTWSTVVRHDDDSHSLDESRMVDLRDDADAVLRVARHRDVLARFYLDGASCKEIAAELGSTPGHVNRMLHEGIDEARSAFGVGTPSPSRAWTNRSTLNVKEVARMVGMSHWTVLSWARLGKFPPAKSSRPGLSSSWDTAEVKAWADDRRGPHAPASKEAV